MNALERSIAVMRNLFASRENGPYTSEEVPNLVATGMHEGYRVGLTEALAADLSLVTTMCESLEGEEVLYEGEPITAFQAMDTLRMTLATVLAVRREEFDSTSDDNEGDEE